MIISSCLTLTSLSMLAFSASGRYAFSLLCLLASGAAQAPIWPACAKVLSAWYPDTRLGSVFGAVSTAPYAGAVAGTALAVYLAEAVHWRVVFVPAALAGVAASALVWARLSTPAELGIDVPGKASSSGSSNNNEEKDGGAAPASFAALWSVPAVRELSASVFFLKFVRYCMYMWLPMYLVEHLGYSSALGGAFSLAFDVGGIVGGPAVGVLLDRRFPNNPILGTTFFCFHLFLKILTSSLSCQTFSQVWA